MTFWVITNTNSSFKTIALSLEVVVMPKFPRNPQSHKLLFEYQLLLVIIICSLSLLINAANFDIYSHFPLLLGLGLSVSKYYYQD